MKSILLLVFTLISFSAFSAELKTMDQAPIFKTQTHEGKDFDLGSRKGKWTVLYFYPKAETPGCTKQACAFRDNIDRIREQGADVYGISTDTVEAQKAFHAKHSLNFTLLADPEAKIVNQYGTKMTGFKMSKRWTFIIDPELRVRHIGRDVDPVLDSEKVAAQIMAFKQKP